MRLLTPDDPLDVPLGSYKVSTSVAIPPCMIVTKFDQNPIKCVDRRNRLPERQKEEERQDPSKLGDAA